MSSKPTFTQGRKVFMTGGHGYIGSRITTFAMQQGYIVRGLARDAADDDQVTALGATPVRGDLQSLDVLRAESAKADVVIHLADPWAQHLGKDYQAVVDIDGSAVDAIAEGLLQGPGRTLVFVSGSAAVQPLPNHAETDESAPIAKNPVHRRHEREAHSLSKSKQGLRSIAIRIPNFVYGRGGSGVTLFLDMLWSLGEGFYIGDGSNHVSAVHVDDLARLFLLADQKGQTGAYNAASDPHVVVKDIVEALAGLLGLNVTSCTKERAQAKAGPLLGVFLALENSPSSAKAKRELGWEPKEATALDEIKHGSYVAVAERIKKGEEEVTSEWKVETTVKASI